MRLPRPSDGPLPRRRLALGRGTWAPFLLGLACAHAPAPRTDDRAAAEALREVQETYRRAWLANDASAVLGVFAPDAVLLPHHGLNPVLGVDAIRQFWFAPGPPTGITLLELEYEEIAAEGDRGLVRGRSRVEWTVRRGSELERWANAGTFLTLLRRGPDGVWRITHHVWDDPPNQRR